MSELLKLNINGLNYAIHVAGEGHPIMLLHGWPDSHKMWRKLTPMLVEAGYKVIAPDLRGFGETDMPKKLKDYKLAKTGDDCIKILDALEVKEPAYLMGHDWGAALGWSMALDYP
ncbi:MAG: alpha/beta fold hydrolase, partial [Bacteroidota bacterium]